MPAFRQALWSWLLFLLNPPVQSHSDSPKNLTSWHWFGRDMKSRYSNMNSTLPLQISCNTTIWYLSAFLFSCSSITHLDATSILHISKHFQTTSKSHVHPLGHTPKSAGLILNHYQFSAQLYHPPALCIVPSLPM